MFTSSGSTGRRGGLTTNMAMKPVHNDEPTGHHDEHLDFIGILKLYFTPKTLIQIAIQ